MKIFKLTYGLMAASMLMLASCNLNDYPEFDDADAFLAFTSSTASIGEESGTLEIPVLLTSKSGMTATAEIEVVADEEGTGAIEGTDFTIENKSLSFSGLEGATQLLKINIVDKFSKLFTGADSVLIFDAPNAKVQKFGNAIHRDADIVYF